MTRLLAAAVALVALVSACSALPTGLRESEEAAPPAPAPKPRPKPKPKQTKVLVTVVDGDTHRRVKGARVVIGRRSDYANTRGLAAVRIRHRTALPVRVSKPGYATRTVRMPFKQRRLVTIRLFREALQWTMFGANPQRTSTHDEIAIRPPFKVVWTRGIGSLIEFPAVVYEGVAYIGNYKGTIYAVSMRNGKVVWRYDPPGGKMASSPAVSAEHVVTHGMDGIVRVLDRRNGRLRWQYRYSATRSMRPATTPT